jgi:uncharacterized membrane protein YkoI
MLKSFPAAIMVGLLPLAGVAFGQGVAQRDYTTTDVAAFQGDANTLANAVQTVERASGGKVLEIRFTDRNGEPGYHAAVLKDGSVEFVHLNPQTGKIASIDAANRPGWMLDMRQRDEIRYAEAAKIPLAQAILTAEQSYTNEPAVAAGIAMSSPTSAVHAYNVLLDAQTGTQRVAVDADSDQIIADPQALAGWPS